MSKLYNDIMKGFKEIAELKNDKKTINEIDRLNKKQPIQPKKSNIKEEIEMSENNLDFDKIDEFFDSLEPEDEVYFVTMDKDNNEGETFFDMDEAINYVEDSVNNDSKVYAFVNLSEDGMDRKSVLVYEKDDELIESKSPITNYFKAIHDIAKDSYETGNVYAIDDFEEFKHVMIDDYPNLANSDDLLNALWEKYWEEIDKLRENEDDKIIKESVGKKYPRYIIGVDHEDPYELHYIKVNNDKEYNNIANSSLTSGDLYDITDLHGLYEVSWDDEAIELKKMYKTAEQTDEDIYNFIKNWFKQHPDEDEFDPEFIDEEWEWSCRPMLSRDYFEKDPDAGRHEYSDLLKYSAVDGDSDWAFDLIDIDEIKQEAPDYSEVWGDDEDDDEYESYKVVDKNNPDLKAIKENFNDTIIIRDELDKLDREDYRDLLNMYDYIVLSDSEKEELANLIINKDIDKIEDYLSNKYRQQSSVDNDFNDDIHQCEHCFDYFASDELFDTPHGKFCQKCYDEYSREFKDQGDM